MVKWVDKHDAFTVNLTVNGAEPAGKSPELQRSSVGVENGATTYRPQQFHLSKLFVQLKTSFLDFQVRPVSFIGFFRTANEKMTQKLYVSSVQSRFSPPVSPASRTALKTSLTPSHLWPTLSSSSIP